MSNEIIRFDQIQDYLDGKLSSEAQQAFEAQMATDPALAEEVGVHRLEREMMDMMLEDDIDNKMQEWQKEKAQLPARTKGSMRLWLLIMIIIIGVAVLLFFILRSNSTGNSQQTPSSTTVPKNETSQPQEPAKKKYNGPVADTEEKPAKKETPTSNRNTELIAMAEEFGGSPEFAGSFVRSAADAESRFDSASVLIQEKRYDAAIRLLQSIPNDDPEMYLNARLNLGYLYFLKQNFKAAIPPLKYAASNRDYLYAEAAEWYLTLAYLGSGNRGEVEKRLNAILADAEHAYYQKANQLKVRVK